MTRSSRDDFVVAANNSDALHTCRGGVGTKATAAAASAAEPPPVAAAAATTVAPAADAAVAAIAADVDAMAERGAACEGAGG